MITTIILTSFILILIGLIINKKNVLKINSSTWFIPKEERMNFNTKGYARLLKRGFIFLGFSAMVMSLIINYLTGSTWTILFFVLDVLIGVSIILFLSLKFFPKKRKKSLKIALIIIGIVFVFVGRNVYKSSIPNELIITENEIEFTGNYGKKILFNDIKNIQITNRLPTTKLRLKGFLLGDIKKGKFKTESEETIHLLINGNYTPALKITTTDNQKLFFNSSKQGINREYEKLQNIFSYQKKRLSKKLKFSSN